MKINYLRMIWGVKIYLAKIKDCKGKKDTAYKQDFFANENKAKKGILGHFILQKSTRNLPQFF